MLNCCIERKILREQKSSANNDGDEFFDCVDDVDQLKSPMSSDQESTKAEGRLKIFDGKTRLFKKSDEFLYIPLTQVKFFLIFAKTDLQK